MGIIHDDAFGVWEAGVSRGLRDDPMWTFNGYRVSLYLAYLANEDIASLRGPRRASDQADQLLRSVTSIGANVAEGLGRSSAAERSRFFGIAIGSLRESIAWYNSLAKALSQETADKRIEQLAELRRILVGAQKWLQSKPTGTQLM